MRNMNLAERLQRWMWVFPALSLLTVIVGQLCSTRCAFLKGDVLGVDLNILGMLFYSLLLVSALLYRKIYHEDWLLKAIAAVVSIGVGGELILIKFQVQNNTYCPKCLISGFFFLVLFFVAARHIRKWVVVLLILLGLLFTSATFNGSVIPSYADEPSPQFGNDKARITLIVYSDYLCPVCAKVDEQINQTLKKMKDRARILFVDVPIHAGSLEYAEVFAYAWFGSGNDLDTAIKVRDLLFDAAKTKMDQAGLLDLLRKKAISFKADKERARELFRSFYNSSMKTDGVTATPTLVVVKDTARKKYVGDKEILKALGELSAP